MLLRAYAACMMPVKVVASQRCVSDLVFFTTCTCRCWTTTRRVARGHCHRYIGVQSLMKHLGFSHLTGFRPSSPALVGAGLRCGGLREGRCGGAPASCCASPFSTSLRVRAGAGAGQQRGWPHNSLDSCCLFFSKPDTHVSRVFFSLPAHLGAGAGAGQQCGGPREGPSACSSRAPARR